MIDLEKLLSGSDYNIKQNQSKLDGLKSLKPLQLEHSDIEASKRYKKLLEFRVEYSTLVKDLTTKYIDLKNATLSFILTLDGIDKDKKKELEDLMKMLNE